MAVTTVALAGVVADELPAPPELLQPSSEIAMNGTAARTRNLMRRIYK
jgi:hypothetical protein